MNAVATRALLRIDDLHVYLGQSHVLQGVSFDVREGGVTALLGRNGVGKTTTVRAVLGLVGRQGTVAPRRRGDHVAPDASHRPAWGRYVPEDRDVFASLNGGREPHARGT